jgi:predicted nucleic acid-binding protein
VDDLAAIKLARAIADKIEKKGTDFVDAWIVEFARERNIKTIYTFDKKHFKETDLNIFLP